MDDYYEIDQPPDEESRPRDAAIDQAIARLRTLFEDSPQTLFYSTQIETLLEREFFHWIVGKGLLEMGNSGEIQRVAVHIGNQKVNFYASRRHRYIRRELKAMLEILRLGGGQV